jgi:hypothetical protein
VTKRSYMLALGLGLLLGIGSNAQFPILDTIATRFFRSTNSLPASSCGTGKANRNHRRNRKPYKFYADPDRRAAFINRVALQSPTRSSNAG